MATKPRSVIAQIYQAYLDYPDNIMFYFHEAKERRSLTYEEAFYLIKCFAYGLKSIRLAGRKIAMIAENSYRWFIADMAVQSWGGVLVPRGADTPPEELRYILNHSQAGAIIVDTARTWERLRRMKLKKLPVIVLEPGYTAKRGVKRYSFDGLVTLGETALAKLPSRKSKEWGENIRRRKPADLMTLIYTSGTTGRPKGVMLTHGNIMHNTTQLIHSFDVGHDDIFLSLLPVWHIYERTCELLVLSRGGSLAYTSKGTLLDDMAYWRPTYFPSVPTVWINIYNKVMRGVRGKSIFARGFFYLFFSAGLLHLHAVRLAADRYFRAGKRRRIPAMVLGRVLSILLWPIKTLGRLLVFKKIVTLTGGRMKNCVSGGGALPRHVEDFFEVVGIPLIVGYGITETSPVVSVMDVRHKIAYTIGPPVRQLQWKVVDEQGRGLPDGEQGEICVKGPCVMKGYYRDRPGTAKAIRRGWFHTGDLGVHGAYNHIQFVGRIKDTIVLENGENVEPQPIEDEIAKSNLVREVMVTGQDRKYLTALVDIDEENAVELLRNRGDTSANLPIRQSDSLCQAVMEDIRTYVNMNPSFRDWEGIKDVRLLPRPLEMGTTLTQSFKKKRNVIQETYKELIDDMYNS